MNIAVALNCIIVLCFSLNIFSSQNVLSIDYCQKKNIRSDDKSLEDRFIIQVREEGVFGGIFDGNGGCRAAQVLQDDLSNNFFSLIKENKAPQEAFYSAFNQVETKLFDEYMRQKNSSWGSTAACFFIDKNRGVHVANIGDSRVLVAVNKKLIIETQDHKPNVPKEKERIEANDGEVVFLNVSGRTPRINGMAISRGIGLFFEKNSKNWNGESKENHTQIGDRQIIAEYDYSFIDLKQYGENSNIAIMAFSDGIIEGKLSNKKIIEYSSARDLVKAAKNSGSKDDISAIIVNFLNKDLSLISCKHVSTGEKTEKNPEIVIEKNNEVSGLPIVKENPIRVSTSNDNGMILTKNIINLSVLAGVLICGYYFFKAMSKK